MIPRDTWSRDLAGAAAHAEHFREPADLDLDADAPDDGEDDEEFHANLVVLTGWL